MQTVSLQKSSSVSFNIFFTFPNSSFFQSGLKVFSNKSIFYALKLPCNSVTAVLINCRTSNNNSLQKFKNVSYLCSSFVCAILMAWNLFPNRNCKTLLLSISKGLILISCSSEDEPSLSLVPHKHTRRWLRVEVQLTKLDPSTQVFETKIDSVREASLSDDFMTLVPSSTCDRHLCTRQCCAVFCCERSVYCG